MNWACFGVIAKKGYPRKLPSYICQFLFFMFNEKLSHSHFLAVSGLMVVANYFKMFKTLNAFQIFHFEGPLFNIFLIAFSLKISLFRAVLSL